MNKEQFINIIKILSAKENFRQDKVEKDYYLTLILNEIKANFGNEIAFKGGTLLNKVYLNYHRLSEDLDFTYSGSKEILTRSQRSNTMKPIREKMKILIKNLNLKSNNPKGEGFNNSTQYSFSISYPSIITGKDEEIKLEIGLRNKPIDSLFENTVFHFYKYPVTNKNLIPENKIYTLSVNETVAEKLRCAITRKEKAIRDFYDLKKIYETGFDFNDKNFRTVFIEKLKEEHYNNDYANNFGLDGKTILEIKKQIKEDLIPVIKFDENFDLEEVFKMYNKLFKEKKVTKWSIEIKWADDQSENTFNQRLGSRGIIWIAQIYAKKEQLKSRLAFNIEFSEELIASNKYLNKEYPRNYEKLENLFAHKDTFTQWIIIKLENLFETNEFMALPRNEDRIREIVFDTSTLNWARNSIENNKTNKGYKSEKTGENAFEFTINY